MDRRAFLSRVAVGLGSAAASGLVVSREDDDARTSEETRWRSTVGMQMATGSLAVRWSADDVRERRVALTFDDGPTPRFTPHLLDVLDAAGVRATFFVIGALVERYPDLVRRAVDAGHEIANHTYDHYSAAVRTDQQVRAAVLRGSDAIERLTGDRPRWLRPPRGEITTATMLAAREAGLEVALWSVNRGNGPDADSGPVAKNLVATIRPGAIVGLHDGIGRSSWVGHPDAGLVTRRTAELTALPGVLPTWHAEGYAVGTLSELIPRQQDSHPRV